MNRKDALQILRKWDNNGKFVFTKHDLAKLFSDDSPKTLTEGLSRLVKDDLLVRACRNIYVNNNAKNFDSYVIEHIAKALRRGEYNYVSLESMLSEYGIISQIPIDRITIITTGRKGVYKTHYGTIEFVHTKRNVENILASIIPIAGRPLRIATKQAALRDLRRVGRNISLINEQDLDGE